LQHVPAVQHVQADDPHRLRHRDDRETGLQRDSLRGAVPGAGLFGGDGRVGHQMRGRTQDAGAVVGEDDRAVHLAQLAQLGRGELHVQRKATRAEGLDGLVPTDHDQRTGVAAQDPLQAVAQRGAWRNRGEHGAQIVAFGDRHRFVPFRSLASGTV
jgi:hypothetical protein